ncbi:heparan-alpha-glucosaminide N-acetyltransferase domain-containing protein [Microbacterium karelineae]|uniref:heparan-alpha-glucosaminide N-acetyltransferase domain-containing protein n=1 Tax=Microbacterium karelineae TaxID=2654283 RepID=UPI0012EA3779|nr:heparan-alpha-glucosaminide N-acetyltransferase domain-containing protein [Microbacterium karelineae]
MAAAPGRGVAGAPPSRRARLDDPGREPGVDLARGLAVFGMFAAHVVVTADAFAWGDPSSWTAAVNGNSSILFATLAGVSLALVTGGSAPHAGARLATDRARIGVRAGCVFVVGVLLLLLPTPVYVILPAYGILFALALPVLRWRPLALVAAAVGIAVIAPFAVAAIDADPFWFTPVGRAVSAALGWHYPFLAWIAFVLAGLALGRAGLSRARVVLAAGLAGVAVSAVGFAVVGRSGSPALSSEAHGTGVGEMLGSGGLAIAIVCACVLVGRTPVRWILWPVRAVGAMPLTAYVAQLIAWSVWVWVRSADGTEVDPYRGFIAIEPFWALSAATLAGCSLWALLLGRGPLEWAIAALARAVAPGRPASPARLGA